jgi:hypothetical protein
MPFAAEQNGPHELADERLPFGDLAEADIQQTKRCSPVLIFSGSLRRERLESAHLRHWCIS